MGKTYASKLTTPQTQPIFGRKDMVKNNAGGFVFQVGPQAQLERFLLCGTTGGTFYVNEKKLTLDNAKEVVSYVQTNGSQVIATVLSFVKEKRLLKQDTAIFVLALACVHGDAVTKKLAYNAIPVVCKTGTHLFTFLAELKGLDKGWSGGLRRGVANWYNTKTPDALAYQTLKYRQRNGFTHKDVLRLCHAVPETKKHNSMFQYLVGKGEGPWMPELVTAYECAQIMKGKQLADVILKYGLSWEMVPTEQLNNKHVLNALLEDMPVMALIRNLNRFALAGLTDGMTDTTVKIINKLTDERLLQNANIHPIFVLNSMMTYASGQGERGNKTWKANSRIVDALNTTFELSFEHMKPSNKKMLVAVDVSGSMNASAAGTKLQCRQVGAVMGALTLKKEKLSELVWFDTNIYKTNFGANTDYNHILKHTPAGGGTDCSLALKYALDKKLFFDAIVIYTDSETYAGNDHNLTLLRKYQEKINKDVKVIEVAMAANPYSNFPKNEKNLLQIVGYDASVQQLIAEFIK